MIRATRVFGRLFPSILTCVVLVATAGASTPSEEGMGPFSIFPQVEQSDKPLEPFRILISAGGEYPRTTIGRASVQLGAGLEWVSKGSSHTAHVSSDWDGKPDNLWSIT